MTEEPYRSEEALVEGLKAGEQLAQLILVQAIRTAGQVPHQVHFMGLGRRGRQGGRERRLQARHTGRSRVRSGAGNEVPACSPRAGPEERDAHRTTRVGHDRRGHDDRRRIRGGRRSVSSNKS
jgi:hypothetical protein